MLGMTGFGLSLGALCVPFDIAECALRESFSDSMAQANFKYVWLALAGQRNFLITLR